MTARTCASRKNKGRRAQTAVVKRILETFPLSESDVRSNPMGCTGEDVWLSDRAQAFFPYAIEVKNTEKISIWEALKQAESPNRKGTPLLVFTRNHADMYCALKFDDFMELIAKIFELETIKDLQQEITRVKEERNQAEDLH